MDATKLAGVRDALLAKQTEVEHELAQLGAELVSFGIEQENERGGLGNHLAEDGSNVQEQERILRVTSDLTEIKTQVDEALERVEDGTFGVCQRCGKPVNPERLDAFPYVAYCIECQTIVERQLQTRPAAAPTR